MGKPFRDRWASTAKHIDGLKRIANVIRKNGAACSVQLHQGGARTSRQLSRAFVGPSDVLESGARGLSLQEVENLHNDFIIAVKRAETVGFDGVEVHEAF